MPLFNGCPADRLGLNVAAPGPLHGPGSRRFGLALPLRVPLEGAGRCRCCCRAWPCWCRPPRPARSPAPAGRSCNAGICTIGGGTGAGANLFHRFSAFDTRGAIGGVLFQTQGHRNLVVGVINPLGTVVDKAVQLSGPANLFWLSPGGISLGSGAGFGNVQTLTLSTATGLRLGGGVFDVFGTTAAQAAALNGDPLPGRAGLLTDPASLAAGGLAANGDLTLSGGLLTVDHSLLLDAQGAICCCRPGANSPFPAGPWNWPATA